MDVRLAVDVIRSHDRPARFVCSGSAEEVGDKNSIQALALKFTRVVCHMKIGRRGLMFGCVIARLVAIARIVRR